MIIQEGSVLTPMTLESLGFTLIRNRGGHLKYQKVRVQPKRVPKIGKVMKYSVSKGLQIEFSFSKEIQERSIITIVINNKGKVMHIKGAHGMELSVGSTDLTPWSKHSRPCPLHLQEVSKLARGVN